MIYCGFYSNGEKMAPECKGTKAMSHITGRSRIPIIYDKFAQTYNVCAIPKGFLILEFVSKLMSS